MSHAAAINQTEEAEAFEFGRPSMTRGLLWGLALSVPLWALIGVIVARLV